MQANDFLAIIAKQIYRQNLAYINDPPAPFLKIYILILKRRLDLMNLMQSHQIHLYSLFQE